MSVKLSTQTIATFDNGLGKAVIIDDYIIKLVQAMKDRPIDMIKFLRAHYDIGLAEGKHLFDAISGKADERDDGVDEYDNHTCDYADPNNLGSILQSKLHKR